MIKLLIETPDGMSEFDFNGEAVLGRDPSCDVQIIDPLSSRKHCRIYTEGEKIFVEDLNSSNGTKLNGTNIKKNEFTNTDCIQIGQVKIKYYKSNAEKTNEKPAEPVLVVVKSLDKTKEYNFNSAEIVLGREDTNDISLNEKLSSRKQFRFLIEEDKVFVEDLKSSNGTKLRNEKIDGKVPYPLGAIVSVGSTEITLVFKNVVHVPTIIISHRSEQQELLINGELIFGRDTNCQFVLKEHNASRRHFKVYLDKNDIYIEDLKSSNGTMLNGVKITSPMVLKQGDVVSVGETFLTLKTFNDNHQSTTKSAAVPAADVPQDVWKVCVKVDLETYEYGLFNGMEVGRGEDCAIIIKEVKSSRKHFKLLIEDKKIFVQDLGSSNGTKIDGVAITKREITENNLIEIGNTKIQVKRGYPDKYLQQNIKGYQVLSCVGIGDNGAVYIAQQVSMKRLVAMKFVAEKFLESAEKKQTFLRDTIELAKVQHPHLLTILESFSYRILGHEVHILVTDYVEGLPLSLRIRKNGKIEINNAVQFVLQACSALEALHLRNLFHKNLKPSVFLITKEGNVRLADAGLSKPELKSEYELSTEAIWYEAPERAKGKPATVASDIYELGASLYHAVTGKVPFEGKTALAVNTKKINMLPEEPFKVNTNISEKLNKIIMKCLQLDPNLRYGSVVELKNDLDLLNAAPVTWNAEDDYRQFERIKRQDYQNSLWVVAGVLAILGVTFNLLAINSNIEKQKLYQSYSFLENIATDSSTSNENKIQRLNEFLGNGYSTIAQEKAKEMIDKLTFINKDATSKDLIDEYMKALDLIDKGDEHIEEGWKILKELSSKVSPDSTFGRKVIKKEAAIRAILKIAK